jgi:hypothetical protein
MTRRDITLRAWLAVALIAGCSSERPADRPAAGSTSAAAKRIDLVKVAVVGVPIVEVWRPALR